MTRISLQLTSALIYLTLLSSAAMGQLTADYTYDDSGFFTSIPAARWAVEAAIADLNSAINQNLAAVSPSDLTVSGTFQTATVTIEMTTKIRSPSTDAMIDFPGDNAQSVVPIYLGAMPQEFSSDGSVLGTGGTASYGFLAGASFSNSSDIEIAARTAGEMASAVFTRGEGPIVSRQSGNFNGDYPFQVEFGLGHGVVSLDNDTDNNGVDDLTEGVDPGDFFHFDHTVAPEAGKVDFYTVALHEAMHAIGLGGSLSWRELVSGSNWMGNEAMSSHGSAGQGIINPDGAHVAAGVQSPRVSDGVMQESVFVSTLAAGERYELTELDLALLRDIGFAGAVPPVRLVGDFDNDGDVDLADLDQYNGVLDSAATGVFARLDLNADGTVDSEDFENHYTTLVETSNGVKGTFAGDVNLDGVVNVLGDAFALVGNLNNPATSWSQGDLNADGTVNVLGDAFLLVGNLGNNNGSASPAGVAVPEPTAFPLLLLWSTLCGFRRRSSGAA